MQRFRARELSSAGSEHLPYKQGVTSSNLVVPTKDTRTTRVFFLSHQAGLTYDGRGYYGIKKALAIACKRFGLWSIRESDP